MALRTPPIRQTSPHLPFADQKVLPFYRKSILSVKQFYHEDLGYIFGVAEEMQEMVRRVGSFDLLKGNILASVFYESTDAYLLILHLGHGASGRQRHPGQRGALLVGLEG
jgi:hypothetical protein